MNRGRERDEYQRISKDHAWVRGMELEGEAPFDCGVEWFSGGCEPNTRFELDLRAEVIVW